MNLVQPSHRRTSIRRSSIEDKSSRTSIDVGSSTNLLNIKNPPVQEEEEKPVSKSISVIKSILNNWVYSTFITSLTIYALFGDDIRVSSTSQDTDEVFYSLTVICFFFFTLEIFLSSLANSDYRLGFFFWLDLIATISLIPDIGWIWDQVIGTSGNAGTSATNATQIARAGRASRAGTRAGRIIRIIRVIRLIRIVKLYKISQSASKKKSEKFEQVLVRGSPNFRGVEIEERPYILSGRALDIEEDESFSHSQSFNSAVDQPLEVKESQESLVADEIKSEFKIPEESKIGKKFSELTTRRVIILVLCMLFILPLFQTTLYLDDNVSYEFGLKVINSLSGTEDFELAWESYIEKHIALDTPLIYLELIDVDTWSEGPELTSLRSSEALYVTVTSEDQDSIAVFDMRSKTRLEAILNITRTVFVCLVLGFSSISLSKDAQELVIEPIENMIEKVKKIAENPLRAAQEEEKRKFSSQIIMNNSEAEGKKHKEISSLETKILEETITKIGALLALGFGEAGSEIIATNMQRVGGEVDPMIPGKKTYCIFGFCDIRNFTEATEVLQQDIMIFVNEIAHIVHKTVDFYSGYANKNIGDAFLLVWKFSEKLLIRNEESKSLELSNDFFVSQIADMAVISFIKIIIEINTDEKVLKYREHIGLVAAIPGFSVNMGFGLHQGWAIEGAIGSEFKIDASYLSPNVNLASRLEAATRQFGVPLLISGTLYGICSRPTQSKLRKVDRVTVKGSKLPLDLYTFDMILEGIQDIIKEEDLEIKLDQVNSKFDNRVARERFLESIRSGSFFVSSLFETDEMLASIRKNVKKSFLKAYASALNDYLDGKWVEARAGFIKAQEIKGSMDGPCQVLLEFIEEFDCKAPADWKGHRELHDK